ncbi:hypothetical protein [Streptomyces xantholiticus]|nr:hypothetical protein [Streptomyces xantholiticus]
MAQPTDVADDANATVQQLQQRAAVDRQRQQAAEQARSHRG